MRSIGNKWVNSIWEANVKSRMKPQSNAPSSVHERKNFTVRSFVRLFRSERERWIRDKYEQKLFLPPLTLSSEQARQSLIDAIKKEDLPTVILLLAHGKIPTDDLNASLVHLAASQGNVPILQLLLWVSELPSLIVFVSLGFSFSTVPIRSFSIVTVEVLCNVPMAIAFKCCRR
jgi:hypothetical protein